MPWDRVDVPMSLWSRISLPSSNVPVILVLHVHKPFRPLFCGYKISSVLLFFQLKVTLWAWRFLPSTSVSFRVVLEVGIPALKLLRGNVVIDLRFEACFGSRSSCKFIVSLFDHAGLRNTSTSFRSLLWDVVLTF